MKREIQVGKTDYSAFVFIPDPAQTDGSGKTGLVAANLTVSGSRMETDNDATVTDYTSSLNDLAALTTAHTDWGLKEVSSTLAPGLYRLDIADALFAAGAWTVVVYVMITTSAAAASPMEFVLVAHDPDDVGTKQSGDSYARIGANGAGLTALPWNTSWDAGLAIVASGTAQGGSASTIQLASATSFADDVVNGAQVVIISGTGAGQARAIIDWTNTSPADTATVSPDWTTAPDNTSVYRVIGAAPAPTALAAQPLVNVGSIYGYSAENWRKMLDGTGGVSLTASFVGSLTGNVSGSVGSVLAHHVDAITALVAAFFARTYHATKMSGLTHEEITALVASAILGKVTGLPTAPVYRNLGDTADAVGASTDGIGNRSAVTKTLASVR